MTPIDVRVRDVPAPAADQPLALVAEVRDNDGRPVAGLGVTFGQQLMSTRRDADLTEAPPNPDASSNNRLIRLAKPATLGLTAPAPPTALYELIDGAVEINAVYRGHAVLPTNSL